jgi:quinol monooxygenase YgiN
MFARLVECRVQSGNSDQLVRTIRDQVLPILQKQPGFVDEITLTSENEPDHVFAISFWNSKADADTYNRDKFPIIVQSLKSVLRETPRVHPCNVTTSTISRISAKAA